MEGHELEGLGGGHSSSFKGEIPFSPATWQGGSSGGEGAGQAAGAACAAAQRCDVQGLAGNNQRDIYKG